jgi:NarL family two-component system response regulator LiaR
MITQTSSTSRDSIRVLIADDHAIVRKGIRALLATEPHIEVVGEAQDGREALTEAQKSQPDVILMDLVMPGMSGLEATRQITAHQPEVRVLVLTSFAGDDKVFPAIKAGALGYLLKDSGPEELVQAIQQVYRGESSLHPSIARKLLRELSDPSERGADTDPLTDREIEVLQLVAQGQSNRDISAQLAISEATVRTHVSKILSKLNLCSRTQAALYALREGLASLHNGEPSVEGTRVTSAESTADGVET